MSASAISLKLGFQRGQAVDLLGHEVVRPVKHPCDRQKNFSRTCAAIKVTPFIKHEPPVAVNSWRHSSISSNGWMWAMLHATKIMPISSLRRRQRDVHRAVGSPRTSDGCAECIEADNILHACSAFHAAAKSTHLHVRSSSIRKRRMIVGSLLDALPGRSAGFISGAGNLAGRITFVNEPDQLFRQVLMSARRVARRVTHFVADVKRTPLVDDQISVGRRSVS